MYLQNYGLSEEELHSEIFVISVLQLLQLL